MVRNFHPERHDPRGLQKNQRALEALLEQLFDRASGEELFVVLAGRAGGQTILQGVTLEGGVVVNDLDVDVDFLVNALGGVVGLFVDGANGNVGIGTASPSSKLHVKSTSGTATAKVEETSGTELERNLLDLVNNGNTAFQLEDTSADGSRWQFKVSGPSFRINKNGTGGDEIVVRDRNDGTGNATLVVNGSVQATNVTFSSSRSLKEGFVPVDPQEVLAKVTALPMTMWQFKADTNGQRHLGPIAEDFHEAFGLGASPASISAIDASGVAMAAIQGLQQELQDVVSKKDQQIDELRGEVSELRALLREMANGSAAAADDAHCSDELLGPGAVRRRVSGRST